MLDKDAIKARLEAATPGPWREGRHVGVVVCDTRTFRYESLEDEARDVEYYGGYPICESALSKDRDLIAHAPTDIADLLAEVERLEATLTRQAKGFATWLAEGRISVNDIRQTMLGLSPFDKSEDQNAQDRRREIYEAREEFSDWLRDFVIGGKHE